MVSDIVAEVRELTDSAVWPYVGAWIVDHPGEVAAIAGPTCSLGTRLRSVSAEVMSPLLESRYRQRVILGWEGSDEINGWTIGWLDEDDQ